MSALFAILAPAAGLITMVIFIAGFVYVAWKNGSKPIKSE
jgi:hypothetical protein